MTHDISFDDDEDSDGKDEHSDDAKHPIPELVFPEERDAVIDGVEVSFRAYIDEHDERKLFWKIGEKTGNNASIDVKKSVLLLPQGRRVLFNNTIITVLSLPRFLTDALVQDFDELEDDSSIGVSYEEFKSGDF